MFTGSVNRSKAPRWRRRRRGEQKTQVSAPFGRARSELCLYPARWTARASAALPRRRRSCQTRCETKGLPTRPRYFPRASALSCPDSTSHAGHGPPAPASTALRAGRAGPPCPLKTDHRPRIHVGSERIPELFTERGGNHAWQLPCHGLGALGAGRGAFGKGAGLLRFGTAGPGVAVP